MLLASPLAAYAAPHGWQLFVRDDLDESYIETQVSGAATTTNRVLGGEAGSEFGRWYYFGDGITIVSTTTPGGNLLASPGREIRVANVPISAITGLSSALSDKANVSAVTAITDEMASRMTTMETWAVQSDWNQSSSTLPGYIKNKPSIPSAFTQVQADWNATNTATSSYIKNKPTVGASYEGTTLRTGTISVFKNATVASGVAVFHLTADGTSGGTSLFPNGIIQDSIDVEVSDSAASYQMSYALSNGNKTITVTANKLTTANILTGILGQAQANGSVVRLMVQGY